MKLSLKTEQLIAKGVQIPNPRSVEIGNDVDIDRISGRNVTLHTGTKVFGAQTFIADGACIGYEGPATVEDCYIGPEVELKGGYFQGAVFLRKAACGLGAHVRMGTILEEEASIAHTVGLKQTILFPFVTLGSLINFCDCLMAGGTGRTNHSEVGSSYIHFNFTPNQDKATPSLIGDVVHGVMLDQSPIFLGGQGGMVGPVRIAFGTVIAAGSICRKDQLKPGSLVIEGGMPTARIPFIPGRYPGLKRLFEKNIHYIAQLAALRHWYQKVRSCFVGPDLPQVLHTGLMVTLDKGIAERLNQLEKLRQKIDVQGDRTNAFQISFSERWPDKAAHFHEWQKDTGIAERMATFLKAVDKSASRNGLNYIATIQGLTREEVSAGTQWMQSIVDTLMRRFSEDIL